MEDGSAVDRTVFQILYRKKKLNTFQQVGLLCDALIVVLIQGQIIYFFDGRSVSSVRHFTLTKKMIGPRRSLNLSVRFFFPVRLYAGFFLQLIRALDNGIKIEKQCNKLGMNKSSNLLYFFSNFSLIVLLRDLCYCFKSLQKAFYVVFIMDNLTVKRKDKYFYT